MGTADPNPNTWGHRLQPCPAAPPGQLADCSLQSPLPPHLSSALGAPAPTARLTPAQGIPPRARTLLETGLTWQQPAAEPVGAATAATVFLKGTWGPRGACAEPLRCVGRNITETGKSVREVRAQRARGSQQAHLRTAAKQGKDNQQRPGGEDVRVKELAGSLEEIRAWREEQKRPPGMRENSAAKGIRDKIPWEAVEKGM